MEICKHKKNVDTDITPDRLLQAFDCDKRNIRLQIWMGADGSEVNPCYTCKEDK